MKSEITYFDKPGEHNTDQVLNIALERYKQGDIDAVVIASTFGKTAVRAAEMFSEHGTPLLIVGEVLEGKQNPQSDVCQKLADQGHTVIWGVPMGQMSKFSRDDSAKLVGDAYKRISEGFKVVCEIVMIGCSTGFIHEGSRVLSIAGTHSGADTAIVAKAAGFSEFMDFQVLEILCKPYQRSAK